MEVGRHVERMKEGWAWRANEGGVGMESGWRRDGHGEWMEEGWAWRADGDGKAWRADGRRVRMESGWRGGHRERMEEGEPGGEIRKRTWIDSRWR
jgi:hypothetical protein